MCGGVSVARISVAVLDTGPLIHLGQIAAFEVLDVIREPKVTESVVRELRGEGSLPVRCRKVALDGRGKDFAEFLVQRHGLGPGESSAIALAKQEGVRLIFMDDLEAREVARQLDLDPRGTLAMIARAYQEGVVSRKDALAFLGDLHTKSTLYLTADLVEWARREISSHRP